MNLASDSQQILAWTGSTLVHGVCIVLAMLLHSNLKISSPSTPLKLEIAFLQPPFPPVTKVLELREKPQSTPLNKTVLTSEVIKPTLTRQPLIETERVINDQRSMPHVTTQDLRHSRPVPMPRPEPTLEPMEAGPIFTATPVGQKPVVESVRPIFTPSAVHSRPVEQVATIGHIESPLARKKEPPAGSRNTVLAAKTKQVALAHHPQAHTPTPKEWITESVLVEYLHESKAKGVLQRTMPVAKEEKMDRERPVPQIRQRTAAVERPLRAYPETQADYGWLAQTIWNQIEKYKRYPTKARQKEWEGKVVLEAVIRRDGTILNLRVAETSGHEILDRDALSLLWKLSPLTLDHALGRPQITILVPLTYQLHG